MTKVLVTSRDPRDIYISLYYKAHQDGKNVRLEGDFNPENVADAQKVFDLIPEYGSYWGYDKEKGAVFSTS